MSGTSLPLGVLVFHPLFIQPVILRLLSIAIRHILDATPAAAFGPSAGAPSGRVGHGLGLRFLACSLRCGRDRGAGRVRVDVARVTLATRVAVRGIGRCRERGEAFGIALGGVLGGHVGWGGVLLSRGYI
jgi:hypothetical protein